MKIKVSKLYTVLFLFLFISALGVTVAQAETTLYMTVEQALVNHPKLKALAYNSQALESELKQSRGAYFPSVELMLGQGVEQYSSEYTRRPDADPSNYDWQSRSDASLRVVQKIYDGGETGSKVSASKARLNSGNYRLMAAAQSVALDAVTAHLTVLRQKELVALAEKNLKFHRDIYKSLYDRAQAGAGSIADVHKVQARLAIAESILYRRKTEFRQAVDNYERVVGTSPGDLVVPALPGNLPNSLEQALHTMESGNPELLLLDADIAEAEAKLKLARTNYMPRVDLELSKMYNYHLEGDRSWRDANTAMVFMRWNLFKGGQDKAGVEAAASRKSQTLSGKRDKLLELTEALSSDYEEFESLAMQEKTLKEAAKYSLKTLDAYWKQFNVSQRSLLDVLSAETDSFQSASQLASVSKNKVIAAYRILKLQGNLSVSR